MIYLIYCVWCWGPPKVRHFLRDKLRRLAVNSLIFPISNQLRCNSIGWNGTVKLTVNISDNFSQREFTAALQHLKPGKALGSDSICPELIDHAGAALKSWLHDFLSSCLHRLKIPKIWRRALVVMIPKPTKPVGDPKSYRMISLLCVPYNILERLIYAHFEPLINPLLPKGLFSLRAWKRAFFVSFIDL